MTKNTGKDYEFFTGKLYTAILASEEMGLGLQKNVNVEVNKILEDSFGNKRQFDIYWEFEIGGIKHKVVIECKDYSSNVSVDIVDSLIGKLRDFPNIRGLIATKKGYQSGAESKAAANGIELLRVREQNESDWIDENGDPLIKEVHINMVLNSPIEVTSLTILYPEHKKEEASKVHQCQNNEIFITNHENNTSYSLLDLQESLINKHENEHGEFTHKEIFNGEINYPNGSSEIKGFIMKYKIAPPYEETIVIDIAKELEGVVEYLSQGKKVKVFSNGLVKIC
ncbi:TPA: restriction endonuclease [Acinetobacter nosocomialis]